MDAVEVFGSSVTVDGDEGDCELWSFVDFVGVFVIARVVVAGATTVAVAAAGVLKRAAIEVNFFFGFSGEAVVGVAVSTAAGADSATGTAAVVGAGAGSSLSSQSTS